MRTRNRYDEWVLTCPSLQLVYCSYLERSFDKDPYDLSRLSEKKTSNIIN